MWRCRPRPVVETLSDDALLGRSGEGFGTGPRTAFLAVVAPPIVFHLLAGVSKGWCAEADPRTGALQRRLLPGDLRDDVRLPGAGPLA